MFFRSKIPAPDVHPPPPPPYPSQAAYYSMQPHQFQQQQSPYPPQPYFTPYQTSFYHDLQPINAHAEDSGTERAPGRDESPTRLRIGYRWTARSCWVVFPLPCHSGLCIYISAFIYERVIAGRIWLSTFYNVHTHNPKEKNQELARLPTATRWTPSLKRWHLPHHSLEWKCYTRVAQKWVEFLGRRSQKFNPLSGDSSGISSSFFKSSFLELLKLPYSASHPETFSGILRLRSSTSLVVL